MTLNDQKINDTQNKFINEINANFHPLDITNKLKYMDSTIHNCAHDLAKSLNKFALDHLKKRIDDSLKFELSHGFTKNLTKYLNTIKLIFRQKLDDLYTKEVLSFSDYTLLTKHLDALCKSELVKYQESFLNFLNKSQVKAKSIKHNVDTNQKELAPSSITKASNFKAKSSLLKRIITLFNR